MNQYLQIDEWRIIEDSFNPKNNRISESLFSIGNGKMGQRANFEEDYSGDSLQGHYVAGVYYPDQTKVGWWKIGYPEYFAKVLNAPSWIGIRIWLDEEKLDLYQWKALSFTRSLHMREGYLERIFRAKSPSGKVVQVHSRRFLSIVRTELGAVEYSLQMVEGSGTLKMEFYLDSDVENEDSNYNEKFWEPVSSSCSRHQGLVVARTRKTGFHVATGMAVRLYKNGDKPDEDPEMVQKEKYVSNIYKLNLEEGDSIRALKYGAVLSSLDHDKSALPATTGEQLEVAVNKGFEKLFKEQKEAWMGKWTRSDIIIEDDPAAQQGIRFNIFQLDQTYTGEDERLNIGPKGFTGEKYGGSTYWDTEAYCLPFYLCTAGPEVGKNLLLYRYRHLEKAIENGEKLGFKDGAALYPMVTMNGEECHNEWEITFEEIHRNGAIAYAICNYILHTGDRDYLAGYGLEVLIGISRFWSQRVNFSETKGRFVMLGVTGPNEYENNVNNNWYTNYIASWTLKYTMESLEYVQKNFPDQYKKILQKTGFEPEAEQEHWEDIVNNLYFPVDETRRVFLQQDGYLDKEQKLVDEISPGDRPLNQNWSWDRILRSTFIKQADVLQGIYFFEDHFDKDTIKRNFDFYEPRTVHESSLSACLHSIIASRLGYEQKAYELYLRTARLDLDDYNNEADQGCHITSMAGTWMAIVEGFGGKRIRNGKLSFRPFIPNKWSSYSFKILYRSRVLEVKVNKTEVVIHCLEGAELDIYVYDQEHRVGPDSPVRCEYKSFAAHVH